MKTYYIEYIVGTIKETKYLEVKNKEEIFSYCQKNNYTLLKYNKINPIIKFLSNIFSKEKTENRKTLNDVDTYKIIKALYIINYAEISTSRRLQYTIKSVHNKKLTPLIYKFYDYIKEGYETSKALRLIGLSDYVVYSVKVGNETGELTEIYKKIMEVLENKLETSKKIRKLLVNPFIYLTLLFGMFHFYMFFYYQQIKEILKYMDKSKFPDITNTFLNWSDYATSSLNHGIIFVLITSVVYWGSIYILIKLVKTIIKFIPGLKNILVYEDYIIFFSLLNVSLSSNTMLFRAIQLATEAIKNYNFKKKLFNASEEIEDGTLFSEITKNKNLFNNDFECESAIANFEETKETKHFEILIQMQKKKLNDTISTLSAFIQPLLLLIVVFFIIILQYAANAPMWTFGEN